MFTDNLSEWVEMAHSIAWDECHKIYILMDEKQTEKMREYGYTPVLVNPDDSLETILDWYEDSCGLRFINAISTQADGTDKYHQVVAQFEEVEG